MIVRLLQEGDAQRIKIQEQQKGLDAYMSNVDLDTLGENGMVWVGEDEKGDIMAIAGFVPIWEGRALVWAMLSQDAGKHFIKIHKAVKKALVECPFRRVEATVDIGFKAGHRWMKMLGFKPEGYMRAYTPDGKDQMLYARVIV